MYITNVTRRTDGRVSTSAERRRGPCWCVHTRTSIMTRVGVARVLCVSNRKQGTIQGLRWTRTILKLSSLFLKMDHIKKEEAKTTPENNKHCYAFTITAFNVTFRFQDSTQKSSCPNNDGMMRRRVSSFEIISRAHGLIC